MSNYANAADVLPPELLVQVQKHWHGCLWIPGERVPCQKLEAIALIQAGMDARWISATLEISRSRVYQIARSLGVQNPFKRKLPKGEQTSME